MGETGDLDRLIARVNDVRGIDLGQYRRAYLERRIAARMRALGVNSYRAYGMRLEGDPDEYRKLLDAITVNVTGFFRDMVVWESLQRHVIEPLVEAKRRGKGRTIRVWSAGCATGEEPYSLAMLLTDCLGENESGVRVSVLGTDLDAEALKTAEKAIFSSDKLGHIPPSYQLAYTSPVDASSFRIDNEITRLVRFSHVSLFDPAPLKVVDLIMCRNVFIYLDRQQQARALDVFEQALTRGGYLILGRSERLSPGAARKYEAVDGKERIYRKPIRT